MNRQKNIYIYMYVYRFIHSTSVFRSPPILAKGRRGSGALRRGGRAAAARLRGHLSAAAWLLFGSYRPVYWAAVPDSLERAPFKGI